MVQWKRIPLPMQEMLETQVWSLSKEDPLRRKWQPTPVFLPGESYGQRSLVGYSPWGPKESSMTERTHTHSTETPSKCQTKGPRICRDKPGVTSVPVGIIWESWHSRSDGQNQDSSRNHSIWGPIKELRAFCLEKGTFKGYVRTTFRVTEMDRMKVPHMGREIMVQLTNKELLAELIRKVQDCVQ